MISPTRPPRNGAQTPWLGLALVLITLAVYWPVRQHEFINYDDPDYVTSNPRTQAGLTSDSITWAFTQKHSSNWHPVTWMSHMLDCQLFGLNPAGHHLVNVALHAANVLLLFRLLHMLTGAVWRGAIVAALFALHPLHVESVAWVSERKDVLSTFFFLLTLLAYAGFVERSKVHPPPSDSGATGSPKSKVWYGVALVFFALGLMSKPMLVTLPGVLLLLDFWPFKRFTTDDLRLTIWPLVREKIPFLLLTMVTCVITMIVQRDSGATVPLSALPVSARLAQMPVAYVRYLGKTFWPDHLAVFYPYVTFSCESPIAVVAAALLLVLSGLVVWQIRHRPFLFAGWFWFLGTLVPVIGLVQVGRQAIADRYTYIPHIGLFIAVVWLLFELLARARISRFAQGAGAAVLLAVCGVLTSRQLAHWKNTDTLARQTIRATKDNYIAHSQLAGVLVEQGKLAEAISECREALRIRPNYAEAHNTLAAIAVKEERYDDAITSYHEAVRGDERFPDPHHGLASLFIKLGRFAEAEQESHEALRIAPLHVSSLFTLAQALHNQNRLDEAMATYQRLDSLRPGLFSSHYGLGSIYALKGDTTNARREFEIARSIQPTNATVHNSLGMILLGDGRVLDASNHFSLAATFDPVNVIANAQLAALLVAAREDARAAVFYHRAVQAGLNQAESLNNFAWLLATSWDDQVRNGAEAVRLAEHACELTQQRAPLLVGTLAAAYAEAGRFDEAVAVASRARDLAREQKQDTVAVRNEELLQLYRARRPFHEPKP